MASLTDWMSLTEWVLALRDLHQKARSGKLPDDERRRYQEERETLAKAILAAQRLRASPNAKGRQSLRVAREMKVEMKIDGKPVQARTVDLGAGGFAVLMGAPPRTGQVVSFKLELDEDKYIDGKARVLSLQRKGKPYRVAFRFEPLDADAKEELALAIFDTAIDGILPREK